MEICKEVCMRKKRKSWNIIILFLWIFFLVGIILGTKEDGEANKNPGPFTLSVTKGLITLEADKAPLEAVLSELSQKTGAKFIIHPSSVSTELLSISLKDLTFLEAMARILKRYSYMIEGEQNPAVTILALKASGEVTAAQAGARVISVQGGTSTGQSGVSSSEEKEGHRQQTLPQGVERPSDLDECQPLEYTEKDAAQNIADLPPILRDRSGSREAEQGNPLLKEVMEQNQKKLMEARIKRAQKVLATDRCYNLWPQAIDELSRIQDDRVTATLADIAGTGKGDRLREKAAQELWHNTADSEFKNTKGVEALRKLAQSSDQRVKRIAQDALRDYERYTRRNK
jgi:hypothetical protein